MRGPGPDPRSGGAGDLVPVPGDPVTAQNAEGVIVANAVSSRDGSFAMDVAPGVYTITEGICAVKAQIEVRSLATTPVKLTIPNSC